MRHLSVLGLVSLGFISLAACGRTTASIETLPLTAEQARYVRMYAQAPSPTQTANKDIQAILTTITEIKGRIDNLQGSVTATESTSSSIASASTEDSALPEDIASSPQTETTTATVAKPNVKTSTPTPAPKLNILKEISDRILNAPALDVIAYQSERGLTSGKKTENHLHLYKMGTQIKIEVMASSPRNAGTKLLYTVGSKRVKVRPGGALSFITTELDQKDDQIASVNNYALYETDFIGMAKRLAEPIYSAQLIGKTTVEGKETYVAKITASAPNTLDSRIQYEHMAYDPKTYEIRYWEAFDGSSQEPYLRYLLKSFEIKQDIPANIFKL
jgi:hypothetical protein